MNTLTTTFVNRLRCRDESAWFELWETFGPVLRRQLTKWGKGRIGVETVRDLSQETLAALSDSIDRYDPTRGARFSTWLLSIAKHVLGDEIDRRMALKRGGGVRPGSLDEAYMTAGSSAQADAEYEAAVFRAKVHAAIRLTERESDFMQFQVYRMRVFDGQSGRQVADQLGVSEPTVSRYLAKVRAALALRLQEIVATYSFTDEELSEAEQKGLTIERSRQDDAAFDEIIGEIYHKQTELHRQDAIDATD